ncbi:acyl-CoA dehydrogenase family protein [Micromonospora sp. NPDC004704]
MPSLLPIAPPSGAGPLAGPRPSDDDPARHWLRITRRVATELATDANARDLANQPPFTEVKLLREAGLLTLLIAADRGGGGQGWPTAYAVVRELARADGSIAQLLGYHYWKFGRRPLADDPEVTERLERETVTHGWFWGGTGTPLDADLEVRPDGSGYWLNGRKTFATGARVADRIAAFATHAETGERLRIVVDPRWPGVVRPDDWDSLGQRLSASGSVEFRDVPITAQDVVGTLPPTGVELPPHQTLTIPSNQVLFQNLYLGVAEGALLAARDYTRTRSRAWTNSGLDSATEDPYVLATYGELVARLQAASALVDQAVTAIEWAHARGGDLTARERGEVAALISAGKIVSTRVALDATARVFDLTGARSTARSVGLDRFWRDVRTHTLHDPVAYKQRELGDFFLNDTVVTPTAYS